MIKKLILLIGLLLAIPSWAQAQYPPEAIATGTTSLTLQPTVGVYTFTGASPATWTLPAVSGNKDRQIIIKNRGSATITVQRAGSDQLYTTSAVTSTTVSAGGWAKLVNDGVYWAVLTAGSGGLASTDIDTSAELAGILTDETGSGAAVFGTSPTFAGGTVSSSTPIITGTQTWNNAGVTFTGLELNVTDSNSASGSLLVDFQVGGSSKFSVRKDGVLTTGKVAASGSYAYGAPQFYSSTYGTNVGMQIKANNEIAFYCSGTAVASVNYDSGITLGSTNSIGWVNGHAIANPPDLFLYRDAANTLALRNGVNAQAFNIYNTWGNSGTDYERLSLYWSGNIGYLTTGKGGTGAGRHLRLDTSASGDLYLGTAGTLRYFISGNTGVFTPAVTNTYDLGNSSLMFARGYFGTSVVTPNVTFGNGTILTADDAANTIALRNGVNAQAFNIYNTWGNSGADYERLFVGWTGNYCYLTTQRAGTGFARSIIVGTEGVTAMYLRTAGLDRWSVIGSGHLTAVTDNTYDIGASGAARPRTGYFGTSLIVGAGSNVQVVANRNALTDYGRFMVQQNGTDKWGIGSRGDEAANNMLIFRDETNGSNVLSLYQGASGASQIAMIGSVQNQQAQKTLTKASATAFVQVAIPSNGYVGGIVHYTLISSDGTDYQSRGGSVPFSAVNKGGTETCNFGTPTDASAVSTGTITITGFDADTSPTNAVNLRCNATTSFASPSTFALRYWVEITGSPVTVTPQ